MIVSHLCAISITYSTVTNAFELLLLLTIVQSLSLNNLNRFCSPQSMRFSVELHLHVSQIICFTTEKEEKKHLNKTKYSKEIGTYCFSGVRSIYTLTHADHQQYCTESPHC